MMGTWVFSGKYCVKIDIFCIIYPIFHTNICFYYSRENNLLKFIFNRCKCSNTSACLISKQTEKNFDKFQRVHKLAEIIRFFPFEVSLVDKYAFGNADILHFTLFVSFVQTKRTNLLCYVLIFRKYSILNAVQIQDKQTQENTKTTF